LLLWRPRSDPERLFFFWIPFGGRGHLAAPSRLALELVMMFKPGSLSQVPLRPTRHDTGDRKLLAVFARYPELGSSVPPLPCLRWRGLPYMPEPTGLPHRIDPSWVWPPASRRVHHLERPPLSATAKPQQCSFALTRSFQVGMFAVSAGFYRRRSCPGLARPGTGPPSAPFGGPDRSSGPFIFNRHPTTAETSTRRPPRREPAIKKKHTTKTTKKGAKGLVRSSPVSATARPVRSTAPACSPFAIPLFCACQDNRSPPPTRTPVPYRRAPLRGVLPPSCGAAVLPLGQRILGLGFTRAQHPRLHRCRATTSNWHPVASATTAHVGQPLAGSRPPTSSNFRF